MPETADNQIILLDEETRRQSIIDYIKKHPGCSAADIDRGQTVSGHVKVSRILKDLKKDRIVKGHRSRSNKRNISLYINKNNRLVKIPEEIAEFEQLFIHFLNELVESISSNVNSLSLSIETEITEYKKALGKEANKKLTSDELDMFMTDPDLHTEAEKWIVFISSFVKAIQIFDEFIRLYTLRSLVEWPLKINDQETVKKLASLVFDRISKMQIRVMEMIRPSLRTLFNNVGDLSQITGVSIDSEEILDYYEYFGLRIQVEPILKHLAKISGSQNKQDLRYPLNKWGLTSPLEVGSETLEEFFNPQEYYERELHEESNITEEDDS
jgi:hypothetical protein